MRSSLKTLKLVRVLHHSYRSLYFNLLLLHFLLAVSPSARAGSIDPHPLPSSPSARLIPRSLPSDSHQHLILATTQDSAQDQSTPSPPDTKNSSPSTSTVPSNSSLDGLDDQQSLKKPLSSILKPSTSEADRANIPSDSNRTTKPNLESTNQSIIPSPTRLGSEQHQLAQTQPAASHPASEPDPKSGSKSDDDGVEDHRNSIQDASYSSPTRSNDTPSGSDHHQSSINPATKKTTQLPRQLLSSSSAPNQPTFNTSTSTLADVANQPPQSVDPSHKPDPKSPNGSNNPPPTSSSTTTLPSSTTQTNQPHSASSLLDHDQTNLSTSNGSSPAPPVTTTSSVSSRPDSPPKDDNHSQGSYTPPSAYNGSSPPQSVNNDHPIVPVTTNLPSNAPSNKPDEAASFPLDPSKPVTSTNSITDLNATVSPTTPASNDNSNSSTHHPANQSLVGGIVGSTNPPVSSTTATSSSSSSSKDPAPFPLESSDSVVSSKPITNLNTTIIPTKETNAIQDLPSNPTSSFVSTKPVGNFNTSTTTPPSTTTTDKDGSDGETFPLTPNNSFVSTKPVGNLNTSTTTPPSTTNTNKDGSDGETFPLTPNNSFVSTKPVGNFNTSIVALPSTTNTNKDGSDGETFPLTPNNSFVSTKPVGNFNTSIVALPSTTNTNKDGSDGETFPLTPNNSFVSTKPVGNFNTSIVILPSPTTADKDGTNLNMNDSVSSHGFKPFTTNSTQSNSSLTGTNLSLLPFKLNGTTVSTIDSNPLSPNNATLVSNPFTYNTSRPIVTLPSLSSHPNNDSFPLKAGDNSTLASPPFNMSLTTGIAPSTTLNKITTGPDANNGSSPALNLTSGFPLSTNATLVSSPFKYDSSKPGNTSLSIVGTIPAIDRNSSNQANTPFPNSNSSSVLNDTISNNNSSSTASFNSTSPYRGQQKPAPAYVPLASLFVNPHVANGAGKSTSPPQPLGTSLPTPGAPPKKEPTIPFPSSWPRYIVPLNEPTSPPANSTLISILFTDALNWPWLVTNSNASTQVLVFMPTLISSALQIPEDEVVTQSLQAYQPANFNSNNQASMLSVWLGYIPYQYVDELQAMIRAPQSRFYSDPNPVLRALAKTVDPTLPISTFEKKTPASQVAANAIANADENSPSVNQGQKIAVIASVTTCGAAILAIGLVILARQSRRRMTGNGQRRHTGPYGLRIGAPMIGSFQRGSDGLPVPHRQMEQVVTPQSMVDSDHPVRYEYGQARTTSETEHPTLVGHSHLRSSWWGRMSAILNRPEDLAPGSPSHEEPATTESRHSPPRRVQITRGADGLVSGIGRPVMKENSLFF